MIQETNKAKSFPYTSTDLKSCVIEGGDMQLLKKPIGQNRSPIYGYEEPPTGPNGEPYCEWKPIEISECPEGVGFFSWWDFYTQNCDNLN